MKDVRSTGFYQSKEWKRTRAYIKQRDKGICQMCGGIVTGRSIVDHIKPLTIYNYKDKNISLNEDNLQYLCIECHNKKTFANQPVLNNGREVNFNKRGNPPTTLLPKFD